MKVITNSIYSLPSQNGLAQQSQFQFSENLPLIQNDDNLKIAKQTISITSFLLACSEIIFGFLQNTPISRIFALTSSAEALGALSLNLPHSDKIMSLVELIVGGGILAEQFAPKKGLKFDKYSKYSQNQFEKFSKFTKIPREHLLKYCQIVLPLMGLTLAIGKNLISKASNNEADRIAFASSSRIDFFCFLESMLLFIPSKLSHFFELPYSIVSGFTLLKSSLTKLWEVFNYGTKNKETIRT